MEKGINVPGQLIVEIAKKVMLKTIYGSKGLFSGTLLCGQPHVTSRLNANVPGAVGDAQVAALCTGLPQSTLGLARRTPKHTHSLPLSQVYIRTKFYGT